MQTIEIIATIVFLYLIADAVTTGIGHPLPISVISLIKKPKSV